MDCTDNKLHHSPQAENASTGFQFLQELQRLRQLCDVVLETSSGSLISAHRVVLAASSLYFRAMFVDGLLESTQRQITVMNFDPDIVEAVVMHAYNADFSLPADRVLPLMLAADYFQMIPLREVCSTFLQQNVGPEDCFGIKSIARQHSISTLSKFCKNFACDHFEEVITCDEYLTVPCDDLKDVISSDWIQVPREENVYLAVLRWVYHDLEERKHLFPEVMSHVRIPFVSPEFLSDLEQEVLMQNEKCQRFITEAHVYKNSPRKRHQMRHSPRIKPHKPFGLKNMILTVGHGSTVEQYDKDTGWTVIGHMDNHRYDIAACFHNGCLYAIGGEDEDGYDNVVYFDSVDCYHVKENRWSEAAPMLQPRK